MTMASFGFACRSHFPAAPLPFVYCVRKVRRRRIDIGVRPSPNNNVRGPDVVKWKTLNAEDVGITSNKISKAARFVLNTLTEKGYEVYLVGGCVRDLILNRTPKDFDVLTSAQLCQVHTAFPPSQCRTVGKRFPICHVLVNHTIIEVSSFTTTSPNSKTIPIPPHCNGCDYRRWRNCLDRDFTINGFMLDPYAKIVYDYLGGMEDIRKAKVRTVLPADQSFQQDCARILRAIRIAARLGFRFSKETAHSIKEFSHMISRLDKGRLLMEMNYMLAFGSAEASLRLLWKVGLLDTLLPIQAAYFVSQGFRRRDMRSNMLLSLFSSLDKLLAPDRPCHDSLWVAILAFHKAILDHPRNPLVVAAFTLAIYNGGDLAEAVKITRSISQSHDCSFPELSRIHEQDLADVSLKEVKDLASSVQTAVANMTNKSFVSQAMAKYPKAPYSDIVFISPSCSKACGIFDCVKSREKGFTSKGKKTINYKKLGSGEVQEVRRVFARVVFDTVYPLNLRA